MEGFEVEYRTWARDKEGKLSDLSIDLRKASDTDLTLQIEGGNLQILVPSTYRNLDSSTSTDHESSEIFILMTGGITSEMVKKSVFVMNERLEKVSIKPNALHQVLDILLAGLQKLQVKRVSMNKSSQPLKHENARERASSDEEEVHDKKDQSDSDNWYSEDDSLSDDDGDINSPFDDTIFDAPLTASSTEHGIWKQGSLHALSEDARKQCEACKSQTPNDLENPLMWLNVVPNPKVLEVELLFDLVGMIDDRVAAGLGLSLNEHVSLRLQFPERTWSATTLQWTEEFQCKVIVNQFRKLSEARDTEPDEIDRYLESYKRASHESFGLDRMIPDLIKKFIAFRSSQRSAQDLECPHMEEFRENVNNKNPFLGLALSIFHQLKLLPQHCPVCWKKLPFCVTRMRSCDRDLCLYGFEEIGLGLSVLDEVKSSPRLVEMELASAAAALGSNRDVFEPFPTFLLKNSEKRSRSGWFSDNNESEFVSRSTKHVEHAAKSEAFKNNKNIEQLREVMLSIPPLSVLQRCPDERSLKRVLTRAWYEHLYDGTEQAPHGGTVLPPTSHGAHKDAAQTLSPGLSMKRSRSHSYEKDKMEPWEKVANLAYNVMQFILMSNRVSICQVSEKDEVLKVETEDSGGGIVDQFVVLHDSPEREACFDQRRREAGGSFFAFHGSSGENWYSILRNGLRSMSHTPFMSSGAAHGTGIYLSTDLSLSMTYAKNSSSSWRHGIHKHGFRCVAICEVAEGSDSSSLKSQFHKSSKVIVSRDERDVAIRYLLVFKPPATLFRIDPLNAKTSGRMLGDLDLGDHYSSLRKSHKDAMVSQQHTRMLDRCKTLSVVIPECGGDDPYPATSPPPPNSSSGTADRHSKRGRLLGRFDTATTTTVDRM